LNAKSTASTLTVNVRSGAGDARPARTEATSVVADNATSARTGNDAPVTDTQATPAARAAALAFTDS
jgi:hypothetical protein